MKKIVLSDVVKKNRIFCRIEKFKVSGNKVSISGWIFSEYEDHLKLYLNLVEKNRIDSHEFFANDLRMDVYERFLNKNSKKSGFSLEFVYSFQRDTNISISYVLDGVERKICIGKIRLSWKEKSLGMMKKVFIICNSIRANGIMGIMSVKKSDRIFLFRNITEQIQLKRILSQNFILEKKDKEWYDITEKKRINIIAIVNEIESVGRFLSELSHSKLTYQLFLIGNNIEKANIYETDMKKKYPEIIWKNCNNKKEILPEINKIINNISGYMILTQTECIFPKYWAERLIAPLLDEKIAAVSPFSNKSGVFCFPGNECKIQLSDGFIEDYENILKGVCPQYNKVPYVDGTCMAMNIDILRKVGNFNENVFIYGFGYDIDWSIRVRQAGYQCIMAENLYVYMKEYENNKEERKDKIKYIYDCYPEFEYDIRKYYMEGAEISIKTALCFKMIEKAGERKKVNLVFSHSLGGGADEYLKIRMKYDEEFGNQIIVVRYIFEKGFCIYFHLMGMEREVYFDDISQIWEIICNINIKCIYINELVEYPEIEEFLKELIKQKQLHQCCMIMLLHDYYAICPTAHLLDYEGKYCNTPEMKKCQECFLKNCKRMYRNNSTISIKAWRKAWRDFLLECDEITAFSQSSSEILKEVYPLLDNIKVLPHKVNYVRKVKKKEKKEKKVRIGILGFLTEIKGRKIVEDMLHIIEKKYRNIEIVIIGKSDKFLNSFHYIETGLYEKENLPDLIELYKIDIIFITSICPETFSYTTEESIRMGIPVACFALGAQEERVSVYEKGIVIKKVEAKYALEEICRAIKIESED